MTFGYSGGFPRRSTSRSVRSGASSTMLPFEWATNLPQALGIVCSYLAWAVSAAARGSASGSRLRRPVDGGDDLGGERREGHAPVVLELVADALARARVADDAVHERQGPVERLGSRVAQVDRERGRAGDRVHDVRAHREVADGGHEVPSDLAGDAAHARDHLRRGDEGVVADAHRRGAGVVLDAVEREPWPPAPD